MTLADLKQEIDDAIAAGLPLDHTVVVSLDGNAFFIDRVDSLGDGCLRIYLEE